MEYKDYYRILGVDKKVDQKTIKSHYRKLAKKYHPDLNPDDEVAQGKFREVSGAYEISLDSEKRQKYDTFSPNYNFQGGANLDPSQYGYSYSSIGNGPNFFDFFDLILGGSKKKDSGRSGSFDFSDIFSDLGDRRGGQGGKKAQDIYESDLTVSTQDAYQGITRSLGLNYQGKIIDANVKIPVGITDGEKIRVSGAKYGLPGSVLFRIHVMDGINLSLKGLNLTKSVEITPAQVALGDHITATTLGGKIKLGVPGHVKPGHKLRVPNEGSKDMKGKRGDLYIESRVSLPAKLSPEGIKCYEELRKLEKNANK